MRWLALGTLLFVFAVEQEQGFAQGVNQPAVNACNMRLPPRLPRNGMACIRNGLELCTYAVGQALDRGWFGELIARPSEQQRGPSLPRR